MYHGRALPDYIVTGDGWRLFVGLSVHLVWQLWTMEWSSPCTLCYGLARWHTQHNLQEWDHYSMTLRSEVADSTIWRKKHSCWTDTFW
jgi:hypothetical protein